MLLDYQIMKYVFSFWFWFSLRSKKFPRVQWQVINSSKVRHSHKLRKDTQEYWLDIKSMDFINFVQCTVWRPGPPGRIPVSVKLFFVWMERLEGLPRLYWHHLIFLSLFYTLPGLEYFTGLSRYYHCSRDRSGRAG